MGENRGRVEHVYLGCLTEREKLNKEQGLSVERQNRVSWGVSETFQSEPKKDQLLLAAAT